MAGTIIEQRILSMSLTFPKKIAKQKNQAKSFFLRLCLSICTFIIFSELLFSLPLDESSTVAENSFQSYVEKFAELELTEGQNLPIHQETMFLKVRVEWGWDHSGYRTETDSVLTVIKRGRKASRNVSYYDPSYKTTKEGLKSWYHNNLVQWQQDDLPELNRKAQEFHFNLDLIKNYKKEVSDFVLSFLPNSYYSIESVRDLVVSIEVAKNSEEYFSVGQYKIKQFSEKSAYVLGSFHLNSEQENRRIFQPLYYSLQSTKEKHNILPKDCSKEIVDLFKRDGTS